MKPKPTSITRREGKRLRWARNIVKQWQDRRDRLHSNLGSYQAAVDIENEILAKRYERAVALIVAHKLSQ